ncbi:iron-sulfur cluster assembly accessory protein [Thaumasiovibrio subtropicus]|uniref:iron-sulfur cluster assembly accessory protein n=1 Tax=Thaumasiovibrio subtropicus TaxID=1891207 RepID=UPI000B355EB4|nr:iron-sulfur cluster assembly accessory protein [Thaumasiovibrio subtropicus]
MDTVNNDTMDFSLDDISWKGLTLTEAAAKRIQQLTSEESWIHISVKPSGCTGYAYVMKQIDAPTDEDLRFESHGAVFFASQKAMPFIDGTIVDYTRDGLNQNFTYSNPNVKAECGCGESFGV